MDSSTKFCPLCKRKKLLMQFSKSLIGELGVYHCCSECQSKNRQDRKLKWCNRCQNFKQIEDFARGKDKSGGRQTFCLVCTREKGAAYRKANPESMNRNHLKRSYGIDREEYEQMAEAQNHRCAICGEPEKLSRNGKTYRFCVDHDHETGAVRELLCSSCNGAIGNLKDDVNLLKSAITYLERHAAKSC